jgi:hypothetical protein
VAKKKQHKLSAQYQRLEKKYAGKGKDFSKTSQGQTLLGYLAKVPYESGGGLGAPDPTYGTGVAPPSGEAEEARQLLIKKMKEAESQKEAERLLRESQKLAKQIRGTGEFELSPDAYFNYRQQLYQANPAAYENVFPVSSGKAVQKLMSPVTSVAKEAATGILKNLGLMKKGKKAEPEYKDFEKLDPSLFHNLTQASAEAPDTSQAEGLLNAGVEVPNVSDLIDNIHDVSDQTWTVVPDQASAVPTDLLDINQYPYTQQATFNPNDTYYFGGGGYELPNLLAQNQNILSLAGGGMVPGYAGGGIMGIDTSKPDYSAFGRFILGNLPQGGVGNMARGIV